MKFSSDEKYIKIEKLWKTKSNGAEDKTTLLKNSRLQLLRLHKMLVDIEREDYERTNGRISSGQFLNLLLNEESLQWLRKFSTLIVEIDEMLDLDDGYSEEMIERHLFAMRDIIDLKTPDKAFNEKYRSFLEKYPEIEKKNGEIKTMIAV